ncbi:MAG: SH3 domain-containing protein [Acutalibacteraceae bacterium]
MKKSLNRIFLTVMCGLILLSTFAHNTKAISAVSIYGAGRVNTAQTNLNVRSSPNKSSAVIGKIPKGNVVTLHSKQNGFWYVSFGNNYYGYCSADYIETLSTNVKRVNVSSGTLRVRKSASLNADTKDYLAKNTNVTVISTNGSFSKIVYNGGRVGYVYSSYLSGNSGSSYNSVKLNVPNFKQTDSRWANVIIGTSGQTISKIGCATTALSMTESYRTNTTIYPNEMAKKLTYSSGGSVYWPDNYKQITSSENYLSKIYNLLQKGVPVILGCKNSGGSMHFVVVTGVKSTTSLKTSDFYINDPGSNTRTTLNQFISAYPNFYKILHY